MGKTMTPEMRAALRELTVPPIPGPETSYIVGRADLADWIERNPRFGQRMKIRAKDGKSLRNPTRTKPVRDWYHAKGSFGKAVQK